MGASNPPDKGTKAPMYCLFHEGEGPEEPMSLETNGRYYGSDGLRSSLSVYRGPGDPPYYP